MRDSAVELVDPPLPLAEWQKALLRRLAPEASDAAIDSLRVTGRCICGCMSVAFEYEGPDVLTGDAEAHDSDGVPLLISFCTNDDETEAAWLEVQRADSEPAQAVPQPDQVTIIKTSRWGGTRPRSLGRHS